jgi:hypothetical protein
VGEREENKIKKVSIKKEGGMGRGRETENLIERACKNYCYKRLSVV